MENTNLLCNFKKILEDPLSWRYYPCNGINQSDETFNYKAFIGEFIRLSEKNNLLFKATEERELEEYSDARIKHIVFTYFLGVLFMKNNPRIKEMLEKELVVINKKNEPQEDYFLFIWFLISIFHDLGYKYEKSEKISQYTDYDNFSTNEIGIDVKQLIARFIEKTSSVVPGYYNNCFPEYLKYRFDSGKIDHGIIAGLILYDELCKIRSKKEIEGKSELNWDEDLDETYLAASSVILVHNIFYTKTGSDDADKYIGMKELILKDGKYKIKFEEYPLLFLFCLIDSIEPLKTMEDEEMLSLIRFNFIKENILEISFDASDCISSQGRISKLKEKILSLNNWLTPVTQKNEIIEIQLF